jgi:lysyl-tRNA synthetase, class II
MHSLVKEATGVDFHEFGNNVEAAKEAARESFKAHSEGKDNSSSLLEVCSSVGHVLNEVN